VATYKVLQDIEAEDHILGPFTLRQFIFAMIAVFLFYICFILIVKHLVFLLVLFLPPAVFFGFFALPFGRDQPTEVWFLAKLRFWFKPRRRIWNQSGVKELVTITVPKKVERVLTNGLSQNEVKSRLSALAQTLDSRGWAVKHAAGGGATYASPMAVVSSSDDRLLSLESLPQEVPAIDPVPAEDMLDETTSPLARQFDTMINQSSQTHRQQLMAQLDNIQAGQGMAAVAAPLPQTVGNPGNWFMAHTATEAPVMEPVVSGGVSSAADDDTLSAQLSAQSHYKRVSFGNLRTMRPLGTSPPPVPMPTPPPTPMPVMPDPAILSLASSNDLNVATLARQAKRNKGGDGSSDEVVISLH
jgi:hypothetical protein